LLPGADDRATVADASNSATTAPEPPLDVQAPIAVPEERPGWHWLRRYAWIAVAVIGIDQLAKAIVRATLPYLDSRTLIPGFADLVHVHNDGVAFGLLNNSDLPFKPLMTTALAGLALAGIGFYARHVREHERMARVGLALILGGAMGNLVDRFRQGYVIDFVDVYWRGWHFWAFNVADAAITVGVAILIVDLLRPASPAPAA
jgi:signal peptidase II